MMGRLPSCARGAAFEQSGTQFMKSQADSATKPVMVKEVMNTEVVTLGRNEKLSPAEQLMRQNRIRHIPIVDDDGKLSGVITKTDLFRGALLRSLGYGTHAEDKLLNMMAIKEVMSERLHTTTPDTPLSEAAAIMLEHRVGCLPVVDNGELVGILTEGDFLRLATLE
jgi:CBS domain-containing protein